jgi:hypothetical protein
MSLDALQDCLAAEHAAVFGYGVVGGVLAGNTPVDSALRELAVAAYVEHRRRRDDLADLIGQRDADPVAAEPAYDLPTRATSVDECRELARLLEDRCAEVYADAVSHCVDDDRELTARGLTACAVRAVAWGARPEPFPGVTEL